MKAIILFAHGARDPDWAQPILAIREAMLARRPEARVELAFLDFIAPQLPQAVDVLVADGYREVVIVPIFMARSGHTKRDLPALLAASRARHPGLAIEMATPIGETASVVASIAAYALEA